jgi:hypothetical protein
MVTVTVLYNLPPGADEEAYLAWRLGPHQAGNVSRPNLVRTSFYRVTGKPRVGEGHPETPDAPYRFITETYFPDEAAFRAAWLEEQEQARIVAGCERITDALFLFSEELAWWERPGD